MTETNEMEQGGGRARRFRRGPAALLVLVLAAAAAACDKEEPTGVGGPLLPGQAVRTLDVVLEPGTYLVGDTAFSGFNQAFGAPFQLVAGQFGGALEAHAMARFDIPRRISTLDTLGVTREDSMPTYLGGRIVMLVDTAHTEGPLPFTVQGTRITEDWDPASARWELRVDSGAIQLPWSTPGAGGGPVFGTAQWPQALDENDLPVDSLVLPVDSATVAAWADTLAQGARGARVVTTTAGVRMRITDLLLRLDARPSIKPDTVVTVTVRPAQPTFIFTPELGRSGETPLVGGRPSWRTYFEFQPGLGDLEIPCPQVSPDCRIRLSEANITYAALLFEPVPSPAGYVPMDSLRLTAHELLVTPLTPLERSPLGSQVGISPDVLGPPRFLPPSGGEPIEVPVTRFLQRLVTDTSQDGLLRWVAVVPVTEGVDFGLAAFQPAPRMRLVLTIANELQLR